MSETLIIPDTKPKPTETNPTKVLTKKYEGKTRESVFKEMFKTDQFVEIDEMLQEIESKGEIITNKNNIIKFTSSTQVGSYKPESFSEMTSEAITILMRKRKVVEEAQKKAYSAHIHERLTQQVLLEVQECFSGWLSNLAQKDFSFRFVDGQARLYTVNMNSQDFEVLSFFAIMKPEFGCYYTPYQINKKSYFLNVYASYAYQKLKTLQIAKNRKGISKEDQSKICKQAASMMEILCSTHQSKIPLQRIQGPKFLENFTQQERVRANFPKILVLMNRVLTIQGNMFSYQTILNLVRRLSELTLPFGGFHYIFKDEICANKWIDSNTELDKKTLKDFKILKKPSEIKDSKQDYINDLNADATQLMCEMTQMMKAQNTEIDRVIGKRKEQSDASQTEKKNYLALKKKDGEDSTSLQSQVLETKTTTDQVNSFNKIIANYAKWEPKVMVKDLLLDTEIQLSGGRGLIEVIEITQAVIQDSEKLGTIPISFKFEKIGDQAYPTMFKKENDYYYVKENQIHQFKQENYQEIENIAKAGLEDAEQKNEAVIPNEQTKDNKVN